MKTEKDQAAKDSAQATLIKVGSRIRQMRLAQGLTSEKLAEAGGITVQYLNELERGKKCMSFLILDRVARGLGVSCDYLVRGEAQVSPLCDAAARQFSELRPIDRELVANMFLQSYQIVHALGLEHGQA